MMPHDEKEDEPCRIRGGSPWVSRNPCPIAGPAQVREILELAA